MKREKLALIGITIFVFGILCYMLGALFAFPRRLFFSDNHLILHLNEMIVWYSGIPILSGIALFLLDLFVLFPKKRINKYIKNEKIDSKKVTVTLTAFNDEKSIYLSVLDFKKHPLVKRVIVVSNNSSDRTLLMAKKAGAIVFNESNQGYGFCFYRALEEAIKFNDTKFVVLCEGDMTYRAYDIDKFISYVPHADIVNGTRISEQLRDKNTQLNMFTFYGNFFVGKLLELKHLGNATFTDVGTTYKICRLESLKKLLPKLNKKINLEFNSYFLDMALQNNLRVIECPITFHKRIGKSKGASSNRAALWIGIKMIKGIFLNWKD